MPFAMLTHILWLLKNVANLCLYQLATMHMQMYICDRIWENVHSSHIRF